MGTRPGTCRGVPLSVWETLLSNEIADAIARRFIARRDVKAIQKPNGAWSPHTVSGDKDGERIPWKRSAIKDHLAGTATYGHYLLNEENQCKLFAFDIDLEKNKPPTPTDLVGYQGHWVDDEQGVHEFDAREAWQDRRHPSRNWSKLQLKMIASKIAGVVTADLEIPCAVAYSGGKGVHVYGFFPELIQAHDARDGAEIVMETLGWKASRGNNFYRSEDQDPITGYPNLTIEVFPKQDTVGTGGLGNLMRLPLGRNLKSKDPTFFIDMTTAMGQMVPVDPMFALTSPSPWKSPND